jgi:hypothetical protein
MLPHNQPAPSELYGHRIKTQDSTREEVNIKNPFDLKQLMTIVIISHIFIINSLSQKEISNVKQQSLFGGQR